MISQLLAGPAIMARDPVRSVLQGLDALRMPEHMKGKRLRTPVVRSLSQSLFREVRPDGKEAIFGHCQRLLDTRDADARMIAFDWAFRCRRETTADDVAVFEAWLDETVDGWGSCDDLCTHALGALLYDFPELRKQSRRWTASASPWVRRAAAVALIYSVRRQAPTPAFEVADDLLLDPHDLVQKGYGWLLKEASRFDQQRVFEFAMNRRDSMPRTAFRYAIEKLNPNLRKAAMAKRAS